MTRNWKHFVVFRIPSLSVICFIYLECEEVCLYYMATLWVQINGGAVYPFLLPAVIIIQGTHIKELGLTSLMIKHNKQVSTNQLFSVNKQTKTKQKTDRQIDQLTSSLRMPYKPAIYFSTADRRTS